MIVGNRVRVVTYPNENLVGLEGVVLHVGVEDCYTEVELFIAPDPLRPHDTNFLFYPEEIEVI